VTEVVVEKDRAMVLENQRQQIEGGMPSLSYTYTALKKDGARVKIGAASDAARWRVRMDEPFLSKQKAVPARERGTAGRTFVCPRFPTLA